MRIPAGVDDGQRIRLKGRGGPGRNGGPSGDLYVIVHVEPDPVFGRSGKNLTIAVPVLFSEAALGTKLTVPTLDGDTVTLKIPEGTPSGKVFRVKGRGVKAKKSAGDLLVTVQITVPRKLSKQQREAVEAFAAATTDSPREHLGVWHHGARRSEAQEMSPNRSSHAVYVISVAAELAGVHPQTLRIYERKGLVEPARTDGGSRRYSEADIELLRRIQQLTDQGLNLAGVKRVLDLEEQLDELRSELDRLQAEVRTAVERTHKQYRRDLVPVRQAVVRFGDSARIFDR